MTADGAFFAVVGILADLEVGSRWLVTPGAGIGYYDFGSGKDLGGSTQFRTQIELGRRLAGDHRLALAMSHLSNAGLNEMNPGTEVLTLYYSIPLGRSPAPRDEDPPP